MDEAIQKGRSEVDYKPTRGNRHERYCDIKLGPQEPTEHAWTGDSFVTQEDPRQFLELAKVETKIIYCVVATGLTSGNTQTRTILETYRPIGRSPAYCHGLRVRKPNLPHFIYHPRVRARAERAQNDRARLFASGNIYTTQLRRNAWMFK